MGFWLRVDEEKNKHIIRDNTLFRNSVNRQFFLTLGREPMQANMFKYCIADILKTMYGGTEDYLSVGYLPARADHVTCIQASRPWNSEGITIELIKDLDDGLNFHTYSITDVSVEDAIKVFSQVLVYYQCPDLSDWDEITDIIMEEIHEHNPNITQDVCSTLFELPFTD